MIEPALSQEPERVQAGLVWLVGIAGVAITGLLIAIAWALVVPPPAYPPVPPSPLHRELFDVAGAGPARHAAGAERLERAAWIDRAAGRVAMPIELAIDAVVADPDLIGATQPQRVGEVRR